MVEGFQGTDGIKGELFALFAFAGFVVKVEVGEEVGGLNGFGRAGCAAEMIVEEIAGDGQDKAGEFFCLAEVATAEGAEAFHDGFLDEVGGDVGVAGAGEEHGADFGEEERDEFLLSGGISADDGLNQSSVAGG